MPRSDHMWRKAPGPTPLAASINGIIYRRMDRLLKNSKPCHENGFPIPFSPGWTQVLEKGSALFPSGLNSASPCQCSSKDKGCAPCHTCQMDPASQDARVHSREAEEGLPGGTAFFHRLSPCPSSPACCLENEFPSRSCTMLPSSYSHAEEGAAHLTHSDTRWVFPGTLKILCASLETFTHSDPKYVLN